MPILDLHTHKKARALTDRTLPMLQPSPQQNQSLDHTALYTMHAKRKQLVRIAKLAMLWAPMFLLPLAAMCVIGSGLQRGGHTSMPTHRQFLSSEMARYHMRPFSSTLRIYFLAGKQFHKAEKSPRLIYNFKKSWIIC